METPSWRQIVGGTAGAALLGAIGYFGQARLHTDASPQKFTSKSYKSSNSKTSSAPLVSNSYSPDTISDSGDFNMPPVAKKIKVDVSGEVVKPGVYELDEGQRVEDLIKLAGGMKRDADNLNVNLALKLKDEQKVIVPAKGVPRAPSTLSSGVNSAFSASNNSAPSDPSTFSRNPLKSSKKQPPVEPVNLNTATEVQLQSVPGIGPTMAKKILDYREANGEFAQLEDLRKVKGMGQKLFDRIHEWITL
jgi:competence protein ComEA